MSKKRNILIVIITIISIGLLLFYINIRKILEYLLDVSFLGIGLYYFFSLIIFLLRSLRLKVIFRSADKNVSYSLLFFSYGVGSLLNEVSPGKTGDLSRMESIYLRNRDLGVKESLSGMAMEYFLDLITLLLVFSCSIFILFLNNIEMTIIIWDFEDFLLSCFISSIFFLIFITIIFLKSNWVLNLTKKIHSTLHKKVKRFFESFLANRKEFTANKIHAIGSFLLSSIIWMFDIMKFILIFRLIGFEINILIIILTNVVVSIPKLLPITPGGWVISELFGSLFLIGLITIPFDSILSALIVEHIIGLSFILVLGILSQTAIHFLKNKN